MTTQAATVTDRWRRHPQAHPLRRSRSTITGGCWATSEFPATDAGYRALLTWMRSARISSRRLAWKAPARSAQR